MRQRPVVIAHRGASAYLPEHTLAGKALAFAMGADFLEQDVVATRDGALLVFHDLILDDMTDVAERFPGRSRADGSFYCIDFTLAEIRTLGLAERRVHGSMALRFPGRFPADAGTFRIPTLAEELRFIQGLQQTTGKRAGIYPEIKEPAWHREQGMDLSVAVLRTLEEFGYGREDQPVFLQCFDAAELKRLRGELNCRLPLVQLLDSGGGQPSIAQLNGISSYANAIGPSIGLILRGASGAGKGIATPLVRDAHDAGLLVHPYTLRRDKLPPGVATFQDALALLLDQLGADGIFTDFPDLAVGYIDQHFSA